MDKDCVVRMEHVWTQFGDHVVHRDINLCVKRGEILGLVGGSGSGKTTLLREMIGLLQPTRGHVYMFGQPLEELGATHHVLSDQCGVLFQGGALFTTLNVFDNVALPLRELRLLDETLINELVLMKLGMVGLGEETATLMPEELSGGMVKRVALARALILEPQLLFLDEPTSGLDPIASEKFSTMLASLHTELGFTVIMITHDLNTLTDLCDRVGVLADAELVALGTLEEVAACDHEFVREFFHGRRAQRVLATAEAE